MNEQEIIEKRCAFYVHESFRCTPPIQRSKLKFKFTQNQIEAYASIVREQESQKQTKL